LNLLELGTEQSNPASRNIDQKNTLEILQIINEEDRRVPQVITPQLPAIAALVEAVVFSFQRGGKLVYIGAGTSGRLGVLDASECPPTYGTDPEMVQGLIAGGSRALVRSIENAEDNAEAGVADLKHIHFTKDDVLVGLTASGQAPYVIAAMDYARGLGARVGAVSCNANSKTFAFADHPIYIPVGPEVVTGSTRMKAGTAQKLVLNMITTTAMIRIGKVYGNLMIDLKPVNKKLVERSKNLIAQATGCDRPTAERTFEESGRRPKIAILMVILGITADEASQLEAAHQGHINQAISAWGLERDVK